MFDTLSFFFLSDKGNFVSMYLSLDLLLISFLVQERKQCYLLPCVCVCVMHVCVCKNNRMFCIKT